MTSIFWKKCVYSFDRTYFIAILSAYIFSICVDYFNTLLFYVYVLYIIMLYVFIIFMYYYMYVCIMYMYIIYLFIM